ncbi:hypothetical protein Dsin_032455 [Dipteronia sinensis]|uniref:Uncharacterized protein n=1 Tax=Dipteronia sinensis TaxID=43782 RepID=A0AAD9ZPQ7_9ROSI|nr:hypothetical protein Dsin_032455 [Dipteronia sinensis]
MLTNIYAPRETDRRISGMINEAERLSRIFCERRMPIMAFIDSKHPNKPRIHILPIVLSTDESNLIPPSSHACKFCKHLEYKSSLTYFLSRPLKYSFKMDRAKPNSDNSGAKICFDGYLGSKQEDVHWVKNQHQFGNPYNLV